MERDGFVCLYCGRKPPEVKLHVDHVIPISSGGQDIPSNLVSSCADCNIGKDDKKAVIPSHISASAAKCLSVRATKAHGCRKKTARADVLGRLNVRAVAHELNVCERTVLRMIKEKQIAAVKYVGQWRVKEKEVERILEGK